MKGVALCLTPICATIIGVIYSVQHKFLYHPQRYGHSHRYDLLRQGPLRVAAVPFETSQGSQLAHYIPPLTPSPTLYPKTRLWILFGGNGMTALDYIPYLTHYRTRCSERYYCPPAAFLLVDYPGYGDCDGEPSPDSILEQSLAAYETLMKRRGRVEEFRLETRAQSQVVSKPQSSFTEETTFDSINLFGHSLGAAAALQFAADPRAPPIDRIVCSAPFTSLADVVAQWVPGLSWLIRHRWDNRRSIQKIAELSKRPHIMVNLAMNDTLTPHSMGVELVDYARQSAPDFWIRRYSYENTGHNNLLENGRMWEWISV